MSKENSFPSASLASLRDDKTARYFNELLSGGVLSEASDY